MLIITAVQGHAVVIAGGGPTGMMLAGELALAGVDVAVVEPRPGPELEGSRAGGLHARTIEVLDQRGIADRFLAEGRAVQVQRFVVPIDIGDFPSRFPHGLALWQKDFERILSGWTDELGVTVMRGRRVAHFFQNEDGVDVTLDDGRTIRARYLVGCDGGRSLVRATAGIDFPGWDPSVSSLIAEADLADPPEPMVSYDHHGTQAIGPLGDGRGARMVMTTPYDGPVGEPTFEELRRALIDVWGRDFGVRRPTWISRFTDATRQAAAYRRGRVLLAGDAAHVHYPIGGQGLNLGVQDAVNLGWKLAQVVDGLSPATLLDTYHQERHPVAARLLRTTMAATALARTDPRIDAVRHTVTELLGMEEPRRRMGAELSGLDIRYGLGGGHPLVGRRMPDVDLATSAGPTRMSTLLHRARPVLAHLDPGTRLELPVVGVVPTPGAVLVRPDGYVAWAGDPGDPDLAGTVATWFGTPARVVEHPGPDRFGHAAVRRRGGG